MVGVVFVAVLIFGLALMSRNARQTARRKPEPMRRSSPVSVPTPTPRFERKSAQPVPSKPDLLGAAYIVDGDTLVIRKTQIRLFGVDAPEMNHPYGNKAKWALVAMCKGQVVRAEFTAQDDYGRTVARCYLPDGRDLSAEMVKIGLAIDWPKFSGGVYRDLETHDARKKLWLADARQKGRMHVWKKFDERAGSRQTGR